MIDWLIDWLIDRSINWLISIMIDWLTFWLVMILLTSAAVNDWWISELCPLPCNVSNSESERNNFKSVFPLLNVVYWSNIGCNFGCYHIDWPQNVTYPSWASLFQSTHVQFHWTMANKFSSKCATKTLSAGRERGRL